MPIRLLSLLLFASGAFAVPTTQDADADPPKTTSPSSAPCADLVVEIGAADAPIERANAGLAAAQCLLTRTSAPILTRLVAVQSVRRDDLLRCSDESLKLIESASRELDAAELDDDEKYEKLEALDRLRAFAEMFAALAADPDADDTKRRLTDACIGLALYADDPREQIVESAKLWQAVAYRLAGKPDRALQVLRPVLETPSARTIGFYSRVTRCRALADRQDYAAAIALALRLEPRVDAWFDDRDRTTRKFVADSMRWLKIEL